jgi:hypothetical protein
MKIFLFNQANASRIKHVSEQMDILGAPLIYYTSFNGHNFALYGSHRLKVAFRKKIRPFFAHVPYIEEIHSEMSIKDFAEYWKITDINMNDANCVFPICPPMKDIVNPNKYFFNDKYRPFIKFKIEEPTQK